MIVIEARAMGMCFGVRDALAATRRVEAPAEVTVFGELVHNPAVARELAARGFAQMSETQRATAGVHTPAVLITAHGVSQRQRNRLLAQGKTLIDTTCPLVARAHRAAATLAREGYFVVVIGRKNHVEVAGLTGDLPPGGFEIVETQMGVRNYGAEKIGIVAQTTTVEREAREIASRVRTLNAPPCEVRFINTICQPTRERQAALEELIGKVDVLVALGGRHSNNTRQLVLRAREVGIRAIHVEEAGDLQEAMFSAEEVVGLTAGTSTLPEMIAAAKARLESFHSEQSAKPVVATIAGNKGH
jgi:4-hydroxy-3-methylbut-2-enyl diphosphate reductase